MGGLARRPRSSSLRAASLGSRVRHPYERLHREASSATRPSPGGGAFAPQLSCATSPRKADCLLCWFGELEAEARRLPSRAGANCRSKMHEGIIILLECSTFCISVSFSPYREGVWGCRFISLLESRDRLAILLALAAHAIQWVRPYAAPYQLRLVLGPNPVGHSDCNWDRKKFC